MKAFVTVGSTKFDKLIAAVGSVPFLAALERLGFTHLTVQHGNSPNPFATSPSTSLTIATFQFDPSLETYMQQADLLIAHAGTGTILEAFDLRKRMIAVPNDTLLHNHQLEFAEALDEMGYLVHATPEGLVDVLLGRRWEKVKPRPPADPAPIIRIIEEEAGLRPNTFF
ncbi:N-acetylglucosaminyldiphosphodolichol N-acetylglucosaminyltransferase catalytic subunit alg13 [Phlyctochytrium bullatum]|nr:N-acetylglucosaminyldiphosphodolichol N-acetylglucosaminyltransferase catalytic subunit alg13 [Phlyctochytrium bullatum]